MKSTPAELKARKRYAAKVKLEVLSRYSPSNQLGCSWVDCPIHDIDMLELDHIDGDGAVKRKAFEGTRGTGLAFYQYLKIQNFPAGYQTLCCNHNRKKELIRRRHQQVLDYPFHK